MPSCPACGHSLEEWASLQGRFCPSCGVSTEESHDWRTDTAERPKVVAPKVPREPPHAVRPPPPARFPLYADEYDDTASADEPVPAAWESATWEPAAWEPRAEPQDWFSHAAEEVAGGPDWAVERRSPIGWLVVALAIVVLVVAGWWYLARADARTDASSQSGQHGSGQLAIRAGHVEMGH